MATSVKKLEYNFKKCYKTTTITTDFKNQLTAKSL